MFDISEKKIQNYKNFESVNIHVSRVDPKSAFRKNSAIGLFPVAFSPIIETKWISNKSHYYWQILFTVFWISNAVVVVVFAGPASEKYSKTWNYKNNDEAKLTSCFFSSEYMRSLTFVTRLLLIGICLEKKNLLNFFVFLRKISKFVVCFFILSTKKLLTRR